MTGDRRENENLLLIRLGAVVTGAASGIRTACVRALKVQGERVISVDRFNQDQTQNLDFPRIYVWCDVTNEADVAKVAEIALNAGGARILVNCAWIGSTTDTVDTDQATSDRVFEVNMKGTFLMCRALLPQMLNPGNGSLEQLKKRQPLSRLGTADEIAAAVTFLAGPQSSFTTGSIFTIDDGMMAA